MSGDNARLDKGQVKAIKKAIVRAVALTELAEEYGVGYMTIYKIAVGTTWRKIKPHGRLIGTRDYRDRRAMSLAKCELIALTKIRKRVSNAAIAEKIGVSESTVRRADINGRAALAVRLDRAMMNGNVDATRREMRIRKTDARRLKTKKVPEWIRREIERNDS